MSVVLSNDEIAQRIEAAFAPLACAITFTHNNERLDFAICDASGTHLCSMEGVILEQVRSEAHLAIVLDYMREQLGKHR